MRWRVLSIVFVFVGLALSAAAPAGAQGETVITLGLSEFMRSMGVEEVLADFEAQNPGIKVQPVYVPFGNAFVPSSVDSLEDHLDAERTLAASADVLLIDETSLSPFGTNAGLFLDLAPLAAADTTLNPADYLPAAWQSFQWDNGLWALPAKVEPFMMIYDVDAFDRAGLTYPTGDWTLDDLANAARVLTQRDASGTVTHPGLITNGFGPLLLRSLLKTSLIDTTTVPSHPRLFTPELQALLEQWIELFDEGVIATQPNVEDMTSPNFAPMQITGSFALSGFTLPGQTPPHNEASLLPGGSVGITASGFAISAGTVYPQQAYELVKFLTQNPRALNMVIGSRPARNDIPVQSGDGAQFGGGGIRIAGASLSPDISAEIETLLPNALPASETRFQDYVISAIEGANNSDAATALQSAELAAVNNLQTAVDGRGTEPLIVATPVPEIVMNPGEIELKFGAGFTAQTGDWERLMRDFATADPEVGKVTLDTDFGQLEDYAGRDDCFYLNYNAIPAVDLSLLLPIDPLLTTDASFSPDDVAGNAMTQLQRDNHTWAYPLNIAPELLRYHVDTFARAGIPAPSGGWTISAFVDALQALKNVIPADKKPFTTRSFGDTYLLALIAAYGGLPIDVRVNPPTINFTDPATVEAIRQVLDMAKADLIDYRELASNFFVVSVSAGPDENPDPLYNDTVGGGGLFFGIGGSEREDTSNPYRLASYPTGTYSTAIYSLGTAYISATAQSPDACYRLFRFLSEHPELFSSMPALRSQFNNPLLTASQGEDAASFYTNFDTLMRDPNTITVSSAFSGEGDVSGLNIIRRWLDKAFDDYVLHDADLSTVLNDAQTKASAFQSCIGGLPPYDPADPDTYAEGIKNCGIAFDPDVANLFGPGPG